MSKSKEWFLFFISFVSILILFGIPIFIACQEPNTNNYENPVSIIAAPSIETKCQDYCKIVAERLSSRSARFNSRHLYVCQSSCNRINDNGPVPAIFVFGERDCKETCAMQCQKGKSCIQGAHCYEECLNNLNEKIPSDRWFFAHSKGTAICHENECVNELCSSLFSEPTQKQKEYEENSSYDKDICNKCYKKCEGI